MTTYRDAPDDLRRAVGELVDENLTRYRRIALGILACGVLLMALAVIEIVRPSRGDGLWRLATGAAVVAGAPVFMRLARRRFDAKAAFLRALVARPDDVGEILVVRHRDETGKILKPLLEVRLANGEKQVFRTEDAKRFARLFGEHCPNARLDEGPS